MSPAADAAITLRELSAAPADRAALAAFYVDIYEQEFPDPDERESLASITDYLQRKARGWYGANNYHVLVAERAGVVQGGCIVDYLERPNAGVIEFLFTAAAARQRGVGSWLLAQAEQVLLGDARRAGHATLRLIAAEMNDPYASPAVPDNLDPFLRARIWDRWGFGALDFPYVQPALSAHSRPVEGLLLIARPIDPPCLCAWSTAELERLLADYLRWAMRIDAPSDNAEFRAMAGWLAARDSVPWLRLKRLIGEDAPQPFTALELRDAQAPEFGAAIDIHRRAVTAPASALAPSDFVEALSRNGEAGCRYHLWALRHTATRAIAGMASFFSLAGIGFGGAVVLEGALRGAGCLRPVLARIEQQMRADDCGVRGWLVECESAATAALLGRCGFHALALHYRPPRQPGSTAAAPLRLLYKPLGRVHAGPKLSAAELLAGLAQVLRHVYRIAAPEAHASYLAVAAQLGPGLRFA